MKKDKTKIMVFGTFDGLHLGHLNFFKQARKLSEPKGGQAKNAELVVSIARDKNVFKIKGARPRLSEKKRFELVKKSNLVDEVVLSGITNHIPHIKKICPKFIALGYDQYAYVKDLKKDLKDAGLATKVVRMKPYKEHIYKNSLLNS